MKYLKILLIIFIMTLSFPICAQENDEEEINDDNQEINDVRDFDNEFLELLNMNDFDYLINKLNEDEELKNYFENDISSENLLRYQNLKLSYSINNRSEDLGNIRLIRKDNGKKLLKANINYDFNGFSSGGLKVGDGVNYDVDKRYIYDGNGTLRMMGHQYLGNDNTGTALSPIDAPGDWRFWTNTRKIVEWTPNYGTYFGESVGREVIIDILESGSDEVAFATVNSGTQATIYLEGAKQALITLKLYKNVDKNNQFVNGELINLNSDADVVLFSAIGLTNQTSENGTQEYFAPLDENIPLYTKLPESEISTSNEFGKTVYYNNQDKKNIDIFADVKNLNEVKAIVGIRGDFNRDPTMHFLIGFGFYKNSFPESTIGYVLEVDPNGGNYSGKKYYEGNAGKVVDIPVPSKEKHVFKGWELVEGNGNVGNNNFTFVNSDAKIRAKYDISEYKINYILNGGTNHKDNPSKYTSDQEIKIKDPTRNNYEFTGWKEGNLIPKGSSGDKTFTANWKAKKYNITYNLYGNYKEDNRKATNNPKNPSSYTTEEEINILNPSREAYEFIKWQEGNKINKGSTGDKHFTAEWKPVKYKITYDLYGNYPKDNYEAKNHKDNPSSYTVVDEINILNPTRENYTFVKWIEGNKINKGSTGDKHFTAEWKPVKYKITYDLYGNYPKDNYEAKNHKDNPSSYTVVDEINILNPTRENYTFVKWIEGNKINKGSTGDKHFTAEWKPVKYKITYDLYGNYPKDNYEAKNHKDNPSSYTVVDEINILNPTRENYTFVKWVEGNKINKGSTGDKHFTAEWKPIKYNITYDLEGNIEDKNNEGINHPDNPSSYTVVDEKNILDPTRNHYDFIKWLEGNIIPKGSSGDKNFTSQWKAIIYKIDYDLDGNIIDEDNKGVNNPDNPFEYTVLDEKDILDPTREHYEFIKWIEGNKIPKGSSGNKKFTAEWKPVIYKINYDLKGNIDDELNKPKNNPDNPNDYTVQDEKDILDPSSEHFEFVEWIEGNKIPKGSSGDKTFTAKWKAIEYPIKYDLYGDYKEKDNKPINHKDNPTKYTILEEKDILDPKRDHYKFLGWKEGNKIEKGTSGEKIFTAIWEPIKYPIEYILNKGENHKDNPKEYTWFEKIEIKEATRKGYTFSGWKEGDYIPLHSEGKQIKTAKWRIINYDIVYHLKGGTNHKDNPSKYTVEDEINILDASKEGYDFVGWKEGNKIPKGSIGMKEFTAEWKLHEYEIKYELDGGTNDPNNPDKYTINDEFELKNPSKPGYMFIGWKEGNKITKGSKGDKVFTAEWKKIEYHVVDTGAK